MLSASLAVFCWFSLIAADPTTSPADLIAGHPAEQQGAPLTVTGTLQFEFDYCTGPQSLGQALISAVCGKDCAGCPEGPCQTQSGVAQSVDAQCVARCRTTTLGQLLQATCICAEPVAVQRACPGGSTVIGISGVTATLNCEPPACLSDSISTDGGDTCPWVAEGACHVRDVERAASGQQNVLYVVQRLHEPMMPQQPSNVHINGFVVPAPQVAPRDVLFTAPVSPPTAFAVPGTEWTQHPMPQMGERDRITHLHEAARHLEAAGLPGEAQSLRQRAQEMEHHARQMLEEKEAQLRHLQHEIDALRQMLGQDHAQSPVSIHSEIIRVSPQGLQALREHGHGFGAGSVNRHEFQQVIEKLIANGFAEVVARPGLVTLSGAQAAFQCRLTSHEESQECGNISCDLSIRPVLHDGCCRLDVQPHLRTTTSSGLRVESAQLSAELDPSQGLLAELTDDGSLLAFVTWEYASPSQPTAAVPPPVTTQQMLVPASAEVHSSSARVHRFNLPVPRPALQSGQIMVTPVFPQPFPARTPQRPTDLQSLQQPVPAATQVPPSPLR